MSLGYKVMLVLYNIHDTRQMSLLRPSSDLIPESSVSFLFLNNKLSLILVLFTDLSFPVFNIRLSNT